MKLGMIGPFEFNWPGDDQREAMVDDSFASSWGYNVEMYETFKYVTMASLVNNP